MANTLASAWLLIMAGLTTYAIVRGTIYRDIEQEWRTKPIECQGHPQEWGGVRFNLGKCPDCLSKSRG